MCPRCHSVERHRLLWLYLNRKTNIFTDHLYVLHVAPEEFLSKRLRSLNNIQYLSGDISPDRAMAQMDITDIQYGDNTFDVILCIHVLEHVLNDRKAMSEMRRVLKPGGWAIIMSPFRDMQTTLEDPAIITSEDRFKFYGQSDHVRCYEKNDYKDRLEFAGFKVDVIDYYGKLGKRAIQYGLLPGEDIYLCKK